jgi:hypothetical protein
MRSHFAKVGESIRKSSLKPKDVRKLEVRPDLVQGTTREVQGRTRAVKGSTREGPGKS